jgi:hypothetical protein
VAINLGFIREIASMSIDLMTAACLIFTEKPYFVLFPESTCHDLARERTTIDIRLPVKDSYLTTRTAFGSEYGREASCQGLDVGEVRR